MLLPYSLLLAVRLLTAIYSPGYIHPDEYFQNPEISAGDVLGVATFRAWEWDPARPCRSPLIPHATTGIPILLLKGLEAAKDQLLERGVGWLPMPITPETLVTGSSVLMASRIAFFLYSLIIDYALVCILGHLDVSKRTRHLALLLLASSYTFVVFHTRPFSNTVESILLALCYMTLCRIEATPRLRKDATLVQTRSMDVLVLGMLFGVGCFTRITFFAFAAPVGLAFIYLIAPNLLRLRWTGIIQIVTLAFGIGLAAGACITYDTIYYRGWPSSLTSFLNSVVFTPLNNLAYNIDADNLADHGLHPWWLHLVVNIPLLFGPLPLLFLRSILSVSSQDDGYGSDVELRGRPRTSVIRAVSIQSVVFGLSVLSVFPHQEPRFLLPLLLPIIIVVSPELPSKAFNYWASWLLFNLVLGFYFGGLHQSGVVPALVTLQQSIATQTGSVALHFHRTFMPPAHLLLRNATSDLETIVLRDHAGAAIKVVGDALKSDCRYFDRVLLIAPSAIEHRTYPRQLSVLRTHWPHIDVDFIDQILEDPKNSISLNVYKVHC